MKLENDLILLRPFTLADAEEHLAGEDAEQVKWVSGGKGTLEGIQNWIKKNQTYWENDGPIFAFAIVEKNSNKLVGFIETNTDSEKLEHIKNGEANISDYMMETLTTSEKNL